MITAIQSSGFFLELGRSVSNPRINSYKQMGGSDQDALCRYLWNTALCEALYPSFQILEVGFRNADNLEIGKVISDRKWLTNESGVLFPAEKAAIQGAKADLMQRTKYVNEDFLVAELRFGFWTSLLDSRYDKLWHKIIMDVFPHMPKTMRTRGDASKLMHTVRRLRDAAFHHHSIWHWSDLNAQHAQMHLLISYVCRSISKMAVRIDRFPKIYADGPKQFIAIAAEISN